MDDASLRAFLEAERGLARAVTKPFMAKAAPCCATTAMVHLNELKARRGRFAGLPEDELALRWRYLRLWGRDHAAYDRYLRFGEPFVWAEHPLFGMRPEENMTMRMVAVVLEKHG